MWIFHDHSDRKKVTGTVALQRVHCAQETMIWSTGIFKWRWFLRLSITTCLSFSVTGASFSQLLRCFCSYINLKIFWIQHGGSSNIFGSELLPELVNFTNGDLLWQTQKYFQQFNETICFNSKNIKIRFFFSRYIGVVPTTDSFVNQLVCKITKQQYLTKKINGLMPGILSQNWRYNSHWNVNTGDWFPGHPVFLFCISLTRPLLLDIRLVSNFLFWKYTWNVIFNKGGNVKTQFLFNKDGKTK